jgi:hypothetical protein
MPHAWLSPLGGEGDTSCRQPFPGHPGLSSAALSTTFFRPLRLDCSIKERRKQCEGFANFEAFVLNKFFTGKSGEYLGNKLAHRLFTAIALRAIAMDEPRI